LCEIRWDLGAAARSNQQAESSAPLQERASNQTAKIARPANKKYRFHRIISGPIGP
jgi:hypothetical protein